MRCEASDDCVGKTDNCSSAFPVGGEPAVSAPPGPTSAIAAAIAQALAQRSTRSFIKEMEVLGIDGNLHAVAELELDVGRERCDEVRPRADDTRRVFVLELLF